MKKAGLIVGLIMMPVLAACAKKGDVQIDVEIASPVEVEAQADDVNVDEDMNIDYDGAVQASNQNTPPSTTQNSTQLVRKNPNIPLDALIGPEVEKPFIEGDQWVELDRSILTDDTYDITADPAGVTANFVHAEVGKKHDGVKYYLEYIDNDSFYITFDNTAGKKGRLIEMFIYDKTFPNKAGEDWSLARASYYIEPGKFVTMSYHIDGKMKEGKPLEFGIAIDDRGFNYKNDKASTFEKSQPFNLDITYYGVDNSVEYEDVSLKAISEKLPAGFCAIK